MAVVLEDEYVGTDGTALEAHSDAGCTPHLPSSLVWSQGGYSSVGAQLIGGRVRASGNGNTQYFASVEHASADGFVVGKLKQWTNDGRGGVTFRTSTDADPVYYAAVREGNYWVLYRRSGGGNQSIGTPLNEGFAAGADLWIKLDCTGTTITCYGSTDGVNFTQKVQAVDNVITAPGRTGIWINPETVPTDTNSIQIDRIWTDESSTPPPPAVNSLTLGSLVLKETDRSIGVYCGYTGDDNGNSSAIVEFRDDTGVWWGGLPMHRPPNMTGTLEFYGSVLLLEPSTQYEVRVTVSDPDGVTGATSVSGFVTTLAGEPTPTPAPTHYVDAINGDNANAGTSLGTAWRTLTHTFSNVTSGNVIGLVAGQHHARATVALPAGASVVCATAPVTYNESTGEVEEANADSHAIIYSGVMSGKTGATETWLTAVAPWTTHTSPNGNVVYRWAGAGHGLVDVQQIGYASTASGQPKRLPHWKADSSLLASADGFADFVNSADSSQQYGFWVDGATNDIYARIPAWEGSSNPNDYYCTLGRLDHAGLTFGGSNCRVSQVVFKCLDRGVSVISTNHDTTIDHCMFLGNKSDIYFASDNTNYATRTRLHRCLSLDSNLWNHIDGATKPPMMWKFVKDYIPVTANSALDTGTAGNGIYEGANRIGASSESQFVYTTGHQQLMVRQCRVQGKFNGIAGSPTADRYGTSETDISGCTFRHNSDDSIEPEYNAINWRIWLNKLEYVFTGISMAPVRYGPIYYFLNRLWRLSVAGIGEVVTNNQFASAFGAYGVKYGSSCTPRPVLYWLHNTLWSDHAKVSGAEKAGGGSGGDTPIIYMRNSITRVTRHAWVTQLDAWNENYNVLATSDATRGVTVGGTLYTTDLAAYRTATGGGSNTNLLDSVDVAFNSVTAVDALFVDPTAGDLTLAAGSAAIDIGTLVNNISSLATQYSGTAPDLGYVEYGGTSTVPVPVAPTNLAAVLNGSNHPVLTWDNPATNEDGTQVWRSANGGDYQNIHMTGVDATTYTDTTVSPGVTYQYQVRNVNAGGSSAFSNIAPITTPGLEPPVNPTPVVPAPSRSGIRDKCFSIAGTDRLVYLSHDGRRVNLHAPPSSIVMGEEGFGAPPIEYVTDRSPFQHGQNVRGFHLNPRVIQLVVRQNFRSRDAYWNGRAALLDLLRPNRVATHHESGKLLYYMANGHKRQIDVLLSGGLDFTPNNDRWDEWALTEVIRFVASDPIWYDPKENIIVFSAGTSAADQLTFGATFPVQFSSFGGSSQVQYDGTWEEHPTIELTGPINSPTIKNESTGDAIGLSYNIPAGETVTINLRGAKSVQNNVGVSLLNKVTADSALTTFSIVPDPEAPQGINNISVGGSGTTGQSVVMLRYHNRYFGI